MLWLARRTRPLVDKVQRPLYTSFVKNSFGQRGRTIRECLRDVFTGRMVGAWRDKYVSRHKGAGYEIRFNFEESGRL